MILRTEVIGCYIPTIISYACNNHKKNIFVLQIRINYYDCFSIRHPKKGDFILQKLVCS